MRSRDIEAQFRDIVGNSKICYSGGSTGQIPKVIQHEVSGKTEKYTLTSSRFMLFYTYEGIWLFGNKPQEIPLSSHFWDLTNPTEEEIELYLIENPEEKEFMEVLKARVEDIKAGRV